MIKLKNENYNAILTETQLKISASSSDKIDKHEYLESYNGGFWLSHAYKVQRCAYY